MKEFKKAINDIEKKYNKSLELAKEFDAKAAELRKIYESGAIFNYPRLGGSWFTVQDMGEQVGSSIMCEYSLRTGCNCHVKGFYCGEDKARELIQKAKNWTIENIFTDLCAGLGNCYKGESGIEQCGTNAIKLIGFESLGIQTIKKICNLYEIIIFNRLMPRKIAEDMNKSENRKLTSVIYSTIKIETFQNRNVKISFANFSEMEKFKNALQEKWEERYTAYKNRNY